MDTKDCMCTKPAIWFTGVRHQFIAYVRSTYCKVVGNGPVIQVATSDPIS